MPAMDDTSRKKPRIGRQEIAARERIPGVDTRDVPLAPDVDLDGVAAATVAMVGADLANLANEAALLAARRTHDLVTMRDFSDARTQPAEPALVGHGRR